MKRYSAWIVCALVVVDVLPLTSVLVFFGLVEAGVRLVEPDLSLPQAEQHFRFTQDFEFELPHHVRDERLGWRLRPGTYGDMRINSQGFRGREFARAATPGTKRIALLGDSCTMGCIPCITTARPNLATATVSAFVLSQPGLLHLRSFSLEPALYRGNEATECRAAD